MLENFSLSLLMITVIFEGSFSKFTVYMRYCYLLQPLRATVINKKLADNIKVAQVITVRGRAINEAGDPVAGAIVFVEIPGKIQSHLIQQAVADSKGYFIFENYDGLNSPREREVYVMGPAVEGSERFAGEPSFISEYLKKPGFRIRLSEARESEIGDVKVNVWYGTVRLLIPARKTSRYQVRSLKNFSNIYVQVKDRFGEIIEGKVLNMENYKTPRGYGITPITLSIPEGQWVIEFAINAHIDLHRKQAVSGKWLRPISLTIVRDKTISIDLAKRI